MSQGLLALTTSGRKRVAGKPHHGKTPRNHAFVLLSASSQAENIISALFLATNDAHEGALLLAADQTPLTLSPIC